MIPTDITKETDLLRALLDKLLQSEAHKFDEKIRSKLPTTHGVYRIFPHANPRQTIRAGRTRTGKEGLQQRVYRNHLMGSQSGNLPMQLIVGSVCADMGTAKLHIRKHFVVQVLAVEDGEMRTRLEHFMLAVLNPQYWDRNQTI